MKLKKLLALTLAGAVLTASLTACTPLEDLYDWLFGGGSSNASRSNGTGLERSETLEESIIRWFELSSAKRQKDEAEPMLQEVAKRFDPESWYTNGQLNGTAKAALKSIAEDKLTLTHLLSKNADVDVWEVQSSPTDAAPSPDRKLYEDEFVLGGDFSNIPTHIPDMKSYSNVKSSMESLYIDTFDLYASVFQKNGKTYAAMVIIWKY